jgi:nucleoside phosphorylase
MLLVAPTKREASHLHAPDVFVCGPGNRSYETLTARLASARPDAIVLLGWCGGLDPSLKAGALILCRDVVGEGEPIKPDESLSSAARNAFHRAKHPFVYSRLVTVKRPAGGSKARTDLWNVHGAGGVDMETYHVARACLAAGVPWLSIRAVLDPFGSSLPRAVRRWSSEEDDQAIRNEALRSPLDWPGYLRLFRNSSRAGHALAGAVPLLSDLVPLELSLAT